MLLLSRKKAMTLVDMLLAVILLNVVVLTGLSIELGMKRIFASADYEIQLLDEATAIVTLITKYINQGIGDFYNFPYSNVPMGGFPTYAIRRDNNRDGKIGAGDIWGAFQWVDSGANQYQLIFYPNDTIPSQFAVLSHRCTSFFIWPPSSAGLPTGVSFIYIQLRKDPTAPAVSFTNPQIELISFAQYRSFTIS